jgi:hypothetical protein
MKISKAPKDTCEDNKLRLGQKNRTEQALSNKTAQDYYNDVRNKVPVQTANGLKWVRPEHAHKYQGGGEA